MSGDPEPPLMRHRVAGNGEIELADHKKRVPPDGKPFYFLIDREEDVLCPLFRGFREKREERIRLNRLPMPPFPRKHVDPLFQSRGQPWSSAAHR